MIFALITLMPFGVVRASDEIDVQWYRTPTIDGRIGQNEYPPPAVSIPWNGAESCKVYVCQNASFLFIAVEVPDETNNNQNDRIKIWLGKEPPSPERSFRTDDYYIIATRSGQWSLDRLEVSNASTTDSSGWRVEVAVSFSELGIAKGRKKAIAIIIEDDGSVRVRWPENAQESSPKTWGTLYSTYSWGTIELVLQSLKTDATTLIVGRNITISVEYSNEGTAPVENVTVGFYVDNSTYIILNDTERIEPHRLGYVSVNWTAIFGNHTISAKLDPFNRIFERNEDNNEKAISVQARMAKLKVRSIQGVNITAGEQTKKVNASGEVDFDVSLGRINLATQNALYQGDTRYVFQRWSNWKNDSTIELIISKDFEIEAFYKKEHRLRFIFQDSDGSPISPQPSKVMLSAPNGSIITLNGTYDVWLQEGTVIVSNIIWSSINVISENLIYRVQGPANLSIRCRIYDVEVRVRDSFDFPVQGANVTLVLPNQTSVWRTTDSEGKAIFIGIPVGRIDGSVSNLGTTTPISGIEITSNYTIPVFIPLSMNTILILVAMLVGIVATLLVIWMKRGAKKQKVPEPLRSLGPPV